MWSPALTTPGMTATLSFQVEAKGSVLRVPNAALRFYPVRDQVRPEDRKLLESGAVAGDADSDTGRSAEVPSAPAHPPAAAALP